MKAFSLPGFIQDFPQESALDMALKSRWNINVESWIQQAMPSAPSYFYNPSTTDIPSGTAAAPVDWFAFPGRLRQYFSAAPPALPLKNNYLLTEDQIFNIADTGFYVDDQGRTVPLPQIPATLCPIADWQGDLKAFGPYGPRGWLDEYCEWSVARDENGAVMRVDFTCENPEYWYSLWAVSPEQVRQIYEDTLNASAPRNRRVTVSLRDLQLVDGGGALVIDPETGRPAYNPLNRWNSGPTARRTGAPAFFTGGAMHLTSTPNTLQTELGLAGAATSQYTSGNDDSQALICCAQYGQEYRNSDPHIGYLVNRIVGGQANPDGLPRRVCLADPVGLYIQAPDLTGVHFGASIVPGRTVPINAQPGDIFNIVRGSRTPNDPVTGMPFRGDMLLHVAFQIPQTWLAMTPSLTLEDLTVDVTSSTGITKIPIKWGALLANQMKIALFARALPIQTRPPIVNCTGTPPAGAPVQCMHQVLWDAYYPQLEPSPNEEKLSLASNTVIVPPRLPANGLAQQLILTCNPMSSSAPKVQVLTLDGSGADSEIRADVTGVNPITYAPPGNSYPGKYLAISVTLTVSEKAVSGLRAIQIIGQDPLSAALMITAKR